MSDSEGDYSYTTEGPEIAGDRKAGFMGLPALGIADKFSALPLWIKVPIVLVMVSIAFYLPYLTILPFAYVRTDLSSGGSDWAGVLFLVVIYMIVAIGLNVVIGLAGLL